MLKLKKLAKWAIIGRAMQPNVIPIPFPMGGGGYPHPGHIPHLAPSMLPPPVPAIPSPPVAYPVPVPVHHHHHHVVSVGHHHHGDHHHMHSASSKDGDNDMGRPSKRQDDADHLEVCRFLIEGSCYTEHAGYYIFQNRFIFSLFPKVVLTCVRYATNLRAIYRQGFLGLNRKYIEHEAGYLLRASATNID